MDRQGGLGPIDNEIVFTKHAGVATLIGLLTHTKTGKALSAGTWASGFDPRHGGHHQLRGQFAQAFAQICSVLQKPDGDRLLQQNRAGIQPFLHRHDSHAGLCITAQNRPLNRASAPPTGQQGTMAVPTAQWRLIKNRDRKDLTERHDNGKIGLQICQLLLARQIVLDAVRREHRKIQFQRQLFHR